MKNKAYYFLFVLYLLMFGFILYINGVFTGQITSRSNLVTIFPFLASDWYSDGNFSHIIWPSEQGYRCTSGCGR